MKDELQILHEEEMRLWKKFQNDLSYKDEMYQRDLKSLSEKFRRIRLLIEELG